GARALPQYGADGDLGPETCGAVKRFQRDWNKNKPYDQIAVNGVPDAQTCARLEEALVAENFRTTAID
ncbi:hypothetical protein KJ782_07315, partial [Patescibacteria group bacterium]|nr:hypothetical protein [Patescibacteria group bacterium]